jgi:hypothetical protein
MADVDNPNQISKSCMITYIKHHVGDLSIEERRGIIQMLVNSSIPTRKIQTKGNGTQIKFRDIPETVVSMIYNYIDTRVSNKKDELRHFPDGEHEEAVVE